MSRVGLPIAGAALVALAALAAVSLLRPGPIATRVESAAALAAELRCPDCEGLSVADSPSRSADEIRRQIYELLADGRTPEQVRRHFVDRYGEWILLAPSAPAAWLIPIAALLGGVGLLISWLRPPRTADARPSASPVSNDVRRRVREEAEALDA
jgi:cytochrome c-type biogenesis protein CcmH